MKARARKTILMRPWIPPVERLTSLMRKRPMCMCHSNAYLRWWNFFVALLSLSLSLLLFVLLFSFIILPFFTANPSKRQDDVPFYQNDPKMPIFRRGKYSPKYCDYFSMLVDIPDLGRAGTKLPALVEDNLSFIISLKDVPLSDITCNGHGE